jgi:hypothetical protein
MIKEHDRVVLKEEVPEQGLKTGDVGTVIHVHKKDKAFEVEFVALKGEQGRKTVPVVQGVQPLRSVQIVGSIGCLMPNHFHLVLEPAHE